MPKINFTMRSLEALQPPATGRACHHDEKTNGLCLMVTAAGSKSFQIYRKVAGRPMRVTLGRFPDMTVEQARRRAAEVNAEIARGEDPSVKRREAREELTFSEFFQEYMERHSRVHKKSWRDDEYIYRRRLEQWGNRKLSAIHKRDVQSLHARTGATNPTGANRMLALLSKMFNLAAEWGMLKTENPATGIKKFSEISRERFLQGDELPLFFKALADEPNPTMRDFFLLCLLTGARRGRVMAMRWKDINLSAATWTLPPDGNEVKPSYTVALSTQALAVLETRSAYSESEWVFPSHSQSGHISEPKTAWKRILERAGIENLRLHDLRRSLGSWQAATGANLSVIGKSLGHRNVSTTAIYARLNLDPVRQSVETATAAMLAAGGILPVVETDVRGNNRSEG